MNIRKCLGWLLLLPSTSVSLGWQHKPSSANAASSDQQITFSGAIPEHGYHLEEGKVLSRSMFQGSSPSNIQIEVRDVLAPPGVTSRIAPLAGPGLLTVHAGEGSITFGGKTDQLSAGDVRPIPAGETLEFANSGSFPMSLRFYLFEGK